MHSTGRDNITARVCQDKGQKFSPADAKVQAEMDRLLNEATQQIELAQAIEIYKKVQRLALENLWAVRASHAAGELHWLPYPHDWRL